MAMREKMAAGRSKRDVKRGPGGQVDVEFLVQMFQLKHGRSRPELRVTNTWAGLEAIRVAGFLDDSDFGSLQSAYDFLRFVEGRLRITTNRALDVVPEAAREQDKLARRLGFEGGAAFLAELDHHTTGTRDMFRKLIDQARAVG
jgi:glutamate-ammonia-ligase adenylyltransferase